MRRVELRLRDILHAIADIQRYCPAELAELEGDVPVQAICVLRLQAIGEAVNNLPGDLRAQHPDVPWQDIVDMRNRLVHGYFDVDLRLVWQVIQHEIDPLKATIEEMLAELGDD